MKEVKRFKDGLDWLTKERNRLENMTDLWGKNERQCVKEWSCYLDKRSHFLGAITGEFDAFCAGLGDEQLKGVLNNVKQG